MLSQLKTYLLLVLVWLSTSTLHAGNYEWKAEIDAYGIGDRYGFQTVLSKRFQVSEIHIASLLSEVDSPSDAYIMLRFGEISYRKIPELIHVYRNHKSTGWGTIAKALEIPSDMPALTQLKNSHDLTLPDNTPVQAKGQGKGKGKGDGSGKGKGKGMGKGKHSATF